MRKKELSQLANARAHTHWVAPCATQISEAPSPFLLQPKDLLSRTRWAPQLSRRWATRHNWETTAFSALP